jgi:hypothetical protein
MKKLIPFLSLFVLLTAFTCEDEPLDDGLAGQAESNLTCANSTLALITATENYGNANEGDANFTTICNTYKTALQNQIIACGDPNGVLQITVNSLGNCMGDDNEPADVEVPGTWKLTAWNVAEATDVNNDGTASTNVLDEIDCYEDETIVFSADNTGVIMSTSYAELSLTIEAGTTDSYVFAQDCIAEIENTAFTWTQTGSTIVITDPTGMELNLTQSGNEMSYTVPDGFQVINSDDLMVTVSQDLTFVYTKL